MVSGFDRCIKLDDKTGGDSPEKLQPFEDEWLDYSLEMVVSSPPSVYQH